MPDVWVEIAKQYADGVPVAAMAKQFNLSRATITRRAKSWAGFGGLRAAVTPGPIRRCKMGCRGRHKGRRRPRRPPISAPRSFNDRRQPGRRSMNCGMRPSAL